jgi:hypothetical protein
MLVALGAAVWFFGPALVHALAAVLGTLTMAAVVIGVVALFVVSSTFRSILGGLAMVLLGIFGVLLLFGGGGPSDNDLMMADLLDD